MDCDDVSWKVNCRTWFVVKDENQMIVATFKYVQDAAKYVQDELVEVMDTWERTENRGRAEQVQHRSKVPSRSWADA